MATDTKKRDQHKVVVMDLLHVCHVKMCKLQNDFFMHHPSPIHAHTLCLLTDPVTLSGDSLDVVDVRIALCVLRWCWPAQQLESLDRIVNA